MERENTPSSSSSSSKLIEQEITDQNKALNVLVSFISVAQKRGAFNLDESAKIWECVKLFSQPSQTN